jgi:alkyl sulfatase BDS1-like metallo-beta-lactamase superfamily hydrolase
MRIPPVAAALRRGTLILAATLALGGCGGGDSRDDSAENTAIAPDAVDNPYPVPFSAPPYLREHARYLEESLIRIGDTPVWDYNTPNRGFGNVIMLEGDDGVVIVDTTTSLDHAAVAARAFRGITDKPVRAIIYTHHHADHINGARAFVDPDAAEAPEVIASSTFLRELEDENQVTLPIMSLRAMYMYGQLLDPESDGRDYHISCCGFSLLGSGATGYLPPTRFVDGQETIEIAGLRLELFQTGGEAASHMAIYLPEHRVLLAGDEIQGPNFPNLHSLRGTKPRDANRWIDAIDRMRRYGAEHLVPSHGQPVSGAQEVAKILTVYRDAIQFTHDQSLRLINKGYTPDQLAQSIALPQHLSLEPWTREMYGTVKHSVREYFVAYISWWSGDPAELDPLPAEEKARRLVALMGGRDRLLAEAEQALGAGDSQWAAELAAYLVRIDRSDMQARYLKASALRSIGYATANTNWRGFYLTAARELEGTVVPRQVVMALQAERFDPADLTSAQLFDLMRYRIDPQAAEDREISVRYLLSDSGEDFTLTLRHSILEVAQAAAAPADLTLTLSRATLDRLFLRDISYSDAISDDLLQVEGSLLKLRSFGAAFDRDPGHPRLGLQ